MLQPLALFPGEPPIRWDAGQLNNLLVWSTQQDVSPEFHFLMKNIR